MAEMTEAAKEARRAYQRAWYGTHREERKESQRRYWERQAEKLQAEHDGSEQSPDAANE